MLGHRREKSVVDIYLYMRLLGYVMRKSCDKLEICGKCLHDQCIPSNSCADFNFTFEANKNVDKNNTNLLNSSYYIYTCHNMCVDMSM